jgi:hypothetical protein
MSRTNSTRQRLLTQRPSLSARRRWVALACIAEVLLVILGVYAEVVLHHIVVLVIAAILAVPLLIVIPVYRRFKII